MFEGLKALKRIENQYNELGIKYKESGCHIREDDYFAIEKELKALDIVNKKEVNVAELKICSTFEEYNKYIYNEYCHFPPAIEELSLSEEEYDSLKEELL